MRLVSALLANCLLAACGSQAASSNSIGQQTSTNQPANGDPAGASTTATSPTGSGSADSPLRPGLYETSIVETIAAVGTSPERRDRECVTSEMAARPESFLNPPSFPGCSATTATRNGAQVRSELQCADNHVISISTSLSSDGWEQSVSGESPNGSYESHETARRVGDC
ncbi:MAG TPA: DUF3617 family protein [Bryobacteraceae bacterium]